jgi:hypothetical protein
MELNLYCIPCTWACGVDMTEVGPTQTPSLKPERDSSLILYFTLLPVHLVSLRQTSVMILFHTRRYKAPRRWMIHGFEGRVFKHIFRFATTGHVLIYTSTYEFRDCFFSTCHSATSRTSLLVGAGIYVSRKRTSQETIAVSRPC